MINSVSVSHFCRGKYSDRSFFYGSYHFIGWEVFIFCDITKSIIWYKKKSSWFFDITNSQNRISDIKKSGLFCDIKKSILWCQKSNLWYHKIDFLISQNRYLDIKKNQGYFVISKNLFCDIEKLNLWYQEIYFVISQNRGFIINRRLIEWYLYAAFTQLRGVGDSTYWQKRRPFRCSEWTTCHPRQIFQNIFTKRITIKKIIISNWTYFSDWSGLGGCV